jgi:energy-converting hydrogenase Eha subunit H
LQAGQYLLPGVEIFCKKKEASKFMSQKILFIFGIVLALTGAGIMFHGNVFKENNSSIATIIGIVGIGLIATSKFRLLKF